MRRGSVRLSLLFAFALTGVALLLLLRPRDRPSAGRAGGGEAGVAAPAYFEQRIPSDLPAPAAGTNSYATPHKLLRGQSQHERPQRAKTAERPRVARLEEENEKLRREQRVKTAGAAAASGASSISARGPGPADQAALPPVVQELVAWAKEKGIQSKVQIRPLSYHQKSGPPVSAIGVVATTAIHQGESIVSVPFDWMINRRSLRQSELKQWIDKLDPPVSDFGAIVLFLMYQRARLRSGSPTDWTPYIRYLDQLKLSTPYYWPEHRVKQVAADQSSYLYRLASTQRQILQKGYNELNKRVQAQLGKEGLRMFGGEFTLADYVWAHQIVSTRYWSYAPEKKVAEAMLLDAGESVVMMMPVTDMLNYAERKYPTLAFDLDNMMLNLVANDHYDEGEEVTFYYGKHCTEEFIVHYGFDTGNSRSCEKMKRELSVSIWENPI